MSKLPEITDGLLQSLHKRIRIVAKGPDNLLWFIDESALNLRHSEFRIRPRFLAPAQQLELLSVVPFYIPVLFSDAEPTIADVFAQLVHPVHPDGQETRRYLSRIGAIEVPCDGDLPYRGENVTIGCLRLYRLRDSKNQ